MKKIASALVALAASMSFAHAGNQDVYITEFTYTALFGEFVEVTNTHATDTVDLTDWSFDDNSRIAGTVAFPADDLLAGKSVIITEVSEAIFVQAWYTEPSKSRNGAIIVANSTANLGRSDEINIYDGSNILVDRLTYNDQATGAAPRSEDVSVVPVGTALGANDYTSAVSDGNGWVISVAGVSAAWKAGVPGATGPAGSPGTYPN